MFLSTLLKPILAMVNPILVIPITVKEFKINRNVKSTAFWLAIVMGYIAYFSRSRYIGDVERYIQMLKLYENVSFTQCFDIVYEGLWAQDIFFWLCAHFQDSWKMMFIVGFFLYYIFFYILLSYANEEALSGKETVFLLCIAISIEPFYIYITSLRSSLAIGIVLFAIYLERKGGSKKVVLYFMYIWGCFTHSAAIVVVVMWFLNKVLKNFRWIFFVCVGIGVALVGSGMLRMDFIQSGILGQVAEKAVEYAAGGAVTNTQWSKTVLSSISANAYRIYFLFIMIMLLWEYFSKKQVKSITQSKREFDTFMIVLCAMIIGMFAFPTAIYLRFTTPAIPLFIAKGYILTSKRTNNKKNRDASRLLWKVLAVCGFVFQSYNLFNSIDGGLFLTHLALGVFNCFFQ